MRTITVEEHYATAAFMDGPGRQLAALADSVREHPQVAAGYELLIKQLCDLGDGRIAAMDAAGIDVQVLSLTSPGAEQLDAPEPHDQPEPFDILPPMSWSAQSVHTVSRAR